MSEFDHVRALSLSDGLMTSRVSTSLCRVIFESPLGHDALSLMTILQESLAVLETWGYFGASATTFCLPQVADLIVIHQPVERILPTKVEREMAERAKAEAEREEVAMAEAERKAVKKAKAEAERKAAKEAKAEAERKTVKKSKAEAERKAAKAKRKATEKAIAEAGRQGVPRNSITPLIDIGISSGLICWSIISYYIVSSLFCRHGHQEMLTSEG